MMIVCLAQFPFPPENVLVPFVWGLLGLLSIAALILSVIVQYKKAFGRVPSLDHIIAGLMTAKAFEDFKEEQRLRHRGLEEQIGKVRHDTSDALMSAMNRGEERDKEIREMGRMIERLQERTETHLRKLDSFDGKLDRLIERWGGK